MNAQPRPTYTLKPDLPDQPPPKRTVEEMQEEYLVEKFGRFVFNKMEGDDMLISQGMIYGKELDEYVWRERERYCIRGFVAGALVMCIIWMIALSI